MERFGGVQYRLADLYFGSLERRGVNVGDVFCRNWPGSIGCEYAFRKRRGANPDPDALSAAVDSRRPRVPANDTLVVHLRLGDVLDMPVYAQRHRCDTFGGCAWVRPVCDYARLAVPPQVRSIEIIGDPHYRVGANGSERSASYLRLARQLLSRTRPTCVARAASPDADFLRMAASRFFFPSGGRFSRLAAEFVARRGGRVLSVHRQRCTPGTTLVVTGGERESACF